MKNLLLVVIVLLLILSLTSSYEEPRRPKFLGLFQTYERQRRYPETYIPLGSTAYTGCPSTPVSSGCGKFTCESFLARWPASGGGTTYANYNESLKSSSMGRCPVGYRAYNNKCKYLGLDTIRALRNTAGGSQALLNYASPTGTYAATPAELAAAQLVISRSSDCVSIMFP
jgi:hypothetical protein